MRREENAPAHSDAPVTGEPGTFIVGEIVDAARTALEHSHIGSMRNLLIFDLI
jgi:hypothetical protein